MLYQVSRNGQMYGPYTLEDLERYVTSGNVLATDLAKSEEMTEWRPVAELLGTRSAPLAAAPAAGLAPAETAYAQPYAAESALDPSRYPDAPNLAWGLYLALTIVTCGLFSFFYLLAQNLWLKKVQPNTKALLCLLVQYSLLILGYITYFATRHPFVPGQIPQQNPLVSLFSFLHLVMFFVTRFVERSSLEEHFNSVEPMSLKLDAVMTFFFGGIYFQSQLNRINERKQAARLGVNR